MKLATNPCNKAIALSNQVHPQKLQSSIVKSSITRFIASSPESLATDTAGCSDSQAVSREVRMNFSQVGARCNQQTSSQRAASPSLIHQTFPLQRLMKAAKVVFQELS
jgi:hypothetical protein